MYMHEINMELTWLCDWWCHRKQYLQNFFWAAEKMLILIYRELKWALFL